MEEIRSKILALSDVKDQKSERRKDIVARKGWYATRRRAYE